ncbi:WD40 repeat-like protein [Flagelloscypha sp. PMI_526]|nr:WD40 repeat-like protein [Flagelloscypha sp. PMI_526]
MGSPSSMLFANFNQEYNCVSVGTQKGYFITNCDPFGRVYTLNDGPRSIVEMLFCTSLVALVGSSTTGNAAGNSGNSQRKLQIVNTKRKSLICELLFPTSILAVKLNRKTLVIVVETEIYVYDISNMRLLHIIETTPNPDAICALSPSSENSYLAYPSPVPSPTTPASGGAATTPTTNSTGTTQSGDVLIFNTRNMSVSNVVQAHKSPIASLSINSSGTMLATASNKGTVIRVWSIPGAEKLYQFRRGTREVHIWPQGGLCFNTASTLLACGSERGTVHIFKLGSSQSSSNGSYKRSSSPSADSMDSTSTPNNDSAGGYEAFMDAQSGSGKKSRFGGSQLRKTGLALGKSLGGYLPGGLTEMWEPQRDFAFLKLPPTTAGTVGQQRCVVGMSGTTPHVYLVSSDGYFYSYTIDLENGGECVLSKQWSLLDVGDDSSGLDV